MVGHDSRGKHLCKHLCWTPVAQGKSGTDLEVAAGPLPIWDVCLEGATWSIQGLEAHHRYLRALQ